MEKFTGGHTEKLQGIYLDDGDVYDLCSSIEAMGRNQLTMWNYIILGKLFEQLAGLRLQLEEKRRAEVEGGGT